MIVGQTERMNRLSQFSAFCATLMILSGCRTVTDMVESNLPEPHSGRRRSSSACGHRKPISTAEDIEPRRRAYPVVAKGTALRLVAFKSPVRTRSSLQCLW